MSQVSSAGATNDDEIRVQVKVKIARQIQNNKLMKLLVQLIV
jgi:hypothetical protein